jgi:hypothetical protein
VISNYKDSELETLHGTVPSFDERRIMASDSEVLDEYVAMMPTLRPLHASLDQSPERGIMIELSGSLRPDNTEDVLRQVVGHFTIELLASLVRPDLERFPCSPLFCPLARTHEAENLSSLVLYEDERLTIAAFLVKRSDNSELGTRDPSRWSRTGVPFEPFDRAVRFLHGSDSELHIWRAPAIGFDTVITREMTCASPETIRCSAGDVLFLRGGTESYTFGDRSSPLVMISAIARFCRSPVVPEYNMGSREIAGVSAADPSVSRIQLLGTVLRQLDPERAIPAMQPLLSHPAHFVRWHAMREMLCADATRAAPLLEEMTEHDPHPQVVAAARSALKMIREQ